MRIAAAVVGGMFGLAGFVASVVYLIHLVDDVLKREYGDR